MSTAGATMSNMIGAAPPADWPPYKTLRTPSERPEIIADQGRQKPPTPFALVDPQGNYIAPPPNNPPFGRSRMLAALPLADQSVNYWLKPNALVHDQQDCYLADPQGNLIGKPGVMVNRLLTARWTEDTRRIAG